MTGTEAAHVSLVQLEPAPPESKCSAFAWVKVEQGAVSVTSGPWRILSRASGRPRVYPPSVRLEGDWAPAVSFDEATSGRIGEIIIEALAKQRFAPTSAGE